jgi:hypothetical protein
MGLAKLEAMDQWHVSEAKLSGLEAKAGAPRVSCLRLSACCLRRAAPTLPSSSLRSTSLLNQWKRTVAFITLRNKTAGNAAGEYFGNERDSMHTGVCEVSWTPFTRMRSRISGVSPWLSASERIWAPFAGHGWIETIDISPVGRRRASGHLYHLYNESVLSDLDQLRQNR